MLSQRNDKTGKGAEILFPRQLEADGTADALRHTLFERTTKLRPDVESDIPLIYPDGILEDALQKAALARRIVYGYDDIEKELFNEERGIDAASRRSASPRRKRISRLILCSRDGSGRFYRRIERLLQLYSARVLVCLVDCDADAFGRILTGRERRIKVVLVEHKDAVSAIFRVLALRTRTDFP
ncbi:MAG TPA: hypothetical protein ENN35_09690 [Deltaproteobacteria bacterium]|nr:hypothetical protein [Deltaproteobacteria bacterium]